MFIQEDILAYGYEQYTMGFVVGFMLGLIAYGAVAIISSPLQ